MATQAVWAPNTQLVQPELADVLRYLARQPIMDLLGRVHGYELLFREGPKTAFSGDGDHATRTMLDNMVLFGLDKLAGGVPSFINCTQESLIDERVRVLPSGMVVLEILDSLEPTPDLIAACRKLKASGFRLALDDFTWKPGFDPLVAMADYIKVDFMLTAAPERKRLLQRLRSVTVALVAEKIESQEEYKQACGDGFTLFQGYYFCRPMLLQNRKIPANRLCHIEILQALRSDMLDLRKLTRLLKHDASLTYRLLRLVNSPMCAIRQEVSSIQSALLAVGENTFRHIAMLAIASEFNTGQPAEILRMAFVRGRFCELAAAGCALEPTEQFLLGMLSLLPAMMRLPMEELAPALPLRMEIRAALQGNANSERILLQWLESHEQGDWVMCDATIRKNGLNADEVVRCYGEALVWAEAAVQSVN